MSKRWAGLPWLTIVGVSTMDAVGGHQYQPYQRRRSRQLQASRDRGEIGEQEIGRHGFHERVEGEPPGAAPAAVSSRRRSRAPATPRTAGTRPTWASAPAAPEAPGRSPSAPDEGALQRHHPLDERTIEERFGAPGPPRRNRATRPSRRRTSRISSWSGAVELLEPLRGQERRLQEGGRRVADGRRAQDTAVLADDEMQPRLSGHDGARRHHRVMPSVVPACGDPRARHATGLDHREQGPRSFWHGSFSGDPFAHGRLEREALPVLQRDEVVGALEVRDAVGIVVPGLVPDGDGAHTAAAQEAAARRSARTKSTCPACCRRCRRAAAARVGRQALRTAAGPSRSTHAHRRRGACAGTQWGTSGRSSTNMTQPCTWPSTSTAGVSPRPTPHMPSEAGRCLRRSRQAHAGRAGTAPRRSGDSGGGRRGRCGRTARPAPPSAPSRQAGCA